MGLVEILILLVIAAICGALGQALIGYSVGGCLVSIVVGVIGAYVGMWIAGQFGLPEPFPIVIEGETFPILWSIIGSALFSLILALIHRALAPRRVVD